MKEDLIRPKNVSAVGMEDDRTNVPTVTSRSPRHARSADYTRYTLANVICGAIRKRIVLLGQDIQAIQAEEFRLIKFVNLTQ